MYIFTIADIATEIVHAGTGAERDRFDGQILELKLTVLPVTEKN